MLLCIDIGNTNMVLGLWGEGKWTARWRVRTAHDKMPDEYAMLLKTLLKDKKYELEDISRVVIASVVPHLKTVLRDLFDRYLGLKPLVLGPHTARVVGVDGEEIRRIDHGTGQMGSRTT